MQASGLNELVDERAIRIEGRQHAGSDSNIFLAAFCSSFPIAEVGSAPTLQESGLDELGRDSVERDERRLQELGRRTVEMFVLSHLFSNRVEVAYREAVALKRQEELIREEEEAEKEAAERVERETADKEKKQSKKQKVGGICALRICKARGVVAGRFIEGSCAFG